MSDKTEANKYHVNVAMSIRAYGSVAIYGETAEEARKTLTAAYIAENFEPHGGGDDDLDDDLDYDHPSDIWLDGSCHDSDTEEDFDFEPTEIPDGDWINDPLGKAAPDMLAALRNCLEQMSCNRPKGSIKNSKNFSFELAIAEAGKAIHKAKGGAATVGLDPISMIIALDPAHSTGVAIMQDGKTVTSHWDNHPDYPVEDWQYEVANGDTRQSYREWCTSKAEQAEGEQS